MTVRWPGACGRRGPLVRGLRRACGATLLAALAAATPAAAGFLEGDVLVSAWDGKVQQHASTGAYVATLDTGSFGAARGTGFDLAGNLYVVTRDTSNVFRFSPLGMLLGSFGGPYGPAPQPLVLDAAGNVHVAQLHEEGGVALRAFDPSGAPLASHLIDTPFDAPDGIDLAGDGCTMHYTTRIQPIKRYDVCTGTQLADFAVLPEELGGTGLRILPDGGLLVAAGAVVVRLDSAGAIVRTYDAPGRDDWFGLSLDPDPSTFWSADRASGEVVRFDLATGSAVSSFNASGGFAAVYDLSVKGEVRAGQRQTLSLSPQTASQPIGARHTVTAHLSAAGRAQPGLKLVLAVTGQHALRRVATTDAAGDATISYTGESPGADTIRACVDRDGDGTCDEGELAGTATATWTTGAGAVPPVPPPPDPAPPAPQPPAVPPPAVLPPVPPLPGSTPCRPSDAAGTRLAPPAVRAQTTPRRDAARPHTFTTTGRVAAPAACSATPRSVLCSGLVTVRFVRRGPYTVSSRDAWLRRDCTFRSRVTFRARPQVRGARLTVRVRFEGNRVLLAKNAPAHAVRVGGG